MMLSKSSGRSLVALARRGRMPCVGWYGEPAPDGALVRSADLLDNGIEARRSLAHQRGGHVAIDASTSAHTAESVAGRVSSTV